MFFTAARNFISIKRPETETPLLCDAEKELNRNMQLLRNVTDYLPAEEHKALYRKLFENIMSLARVLFPDADTQTCANHVLVILKDAVAIGTLRRDYLLPAGRKNTDYRKYEDIYTHALVTAVAVEGAVELSGGLYVPPGVQGLQEWLDGLPESSEEPRGGPALWAKAILPPRGFAMLKDDPMVWVDWLAYFDDPQNSVMAQIAVKGRAWARTGIHPNNAKPTPAVDSKAIAATLERKIAAQQGATVNQPRQAGWDVIEAIKAALADGTLTACQSGAIVQVDRDGRTFLQVPEIFAWYQANYAPEDEVKTLRNRLTKLKITERANGRDIFKGKLTASDPEQEGVVIADPSVLWETGAELSGAFVLEGVFPEKGQQRLL